jgi:hypothetical protein
MVLLHHINPRFVLGRLDCHALSSHGSSSWLPLRSSLRSSLGGGGQGPVMCYLFGVRSRERSETVGVDVGGAAARRGTWASSQSKCQGPNGATGQPAGCSSAADLPPLAGGCPVAGLPHALPGHGANGGWRVPEKSYTNPAAPSAPADASVPARRAPHRHQQHCYSWGCKWAPATKWGTPVRQQRNAQCAPTSGTRGGKQPAQIAGPLPLPLPAAAARCRPWRELGPALIYGF